MLLKTKDGIVCDKCSTIYQNKFTYYSVDCSKVHVDVPRRYTTKAVPECDFDICEGCWSNIEDLIRKFGREPSKTSIFCELCGSENTGVFDYFFIYISLVEVDKEAAPDDGITNVDRNINTIRICISCMLKMQKTKEEIMSKKEVKEWN